MTSAIDCAVSGCDREAVVLLPVVARTVWRDGAEGHRPDPQALRRICAHLRAMRTAKARAVRAALLPLTGEPS